MSDTARQFRSYTMIEMVVVLVIITLVVTMVIPKVGSGSKRMAREQGLSAFREAYGQCAMRSRATAKPLGLVLQPEQGVFQVVSLPSSLDKDWHPPVLAGQGGEGKTRTSILSGAESYPVPDGVEWTDLPENTDGYEGILFSFYPDGEACGPEIAWKMHGVSYRLIIDSVLGRATILEEE